MIEYRIRCVDGRGRGYGGLPDGTYQGTLLVLEFADSECRGVTKETSRKHAHYMESREVGEWSRVRDGELAL